MLADERAILAALAFAYSLDIPNLKLPDWLSVSAAGITEKVGRPYESTLTITTASDIDLQDALDRSVTFSGNPGARHRLAQHHFKTMGDVLKAD